ncbi:hypothetical protein [Xanthomonas citri]|uniref:hypothetical protein n=1 Tax=Xanthomonas citri TaxID=346 RepID=UPI000F5A8223|nr:hypothetical protein [Xanthomonas citri]
MAFVDDVRNILGALDDYWADVATRLGTWGFKAFPAAVLISWMIAHQRDGKTGLSDQDAALLAQVETQRNKVSATEEAQKLHRLIPPQLNMADWKNLRDEAIQIDGRPTVLAYLFAAFFRGELRRDNLRSTILTVSRSLRHG